MQSQRGIASCKDLIATNLNRIATLSVGIISLCIDAIRPLLGPRSVCIYPVTCRCYVKNILRQKPLYLSVPLIAFRLLSCNPATALYRRYKHRPSQ